MEINDIKKFLEENKDSDDVKQLRSSFMPTLDQAMETEEFQKAMKSFADKEASRQVEAYKTNTFSKAVEDEVTKRIEAKNHKEPWQIKMDEMEKKYTDLQSQVAEKERAELFQKNKNSALHSLQEKNITIPDNILDRFISSESEKTSENIGAFTGWIDEYTQSLKADKLKNNNVYVPGDKSSKTTNIQAPGEDASQSDWEAYFKNKGK